MGERPILFSTPMVRAILDGRKSQTRRVLKPQPNLVREPEHPYRVGQRLWVRETWSHDGPDLETVRARLEDAMGGIGYGPYYRATEVAPDTLYWRPSIHIPRWASRLTLTVTDVRVQRLQEISEADARAEGVEHRLDWLPQYRGTPDLPWRSEFPRDAFADLWNSINAKRPGCAWDDNPWVVAVSFTSERRNIDAGAPHA